MNFKSFNLKPVVQEGIDAMGFSTPTPIQIEAIPIIQNGDDLIGCAQTGTGKTAAFLLPIINKLSESSDEKIRCVVIVPTRELAMQIDQQLDGFGYFCPISSIPVYGGGQGDVFETQKKAITTGADILIATPGRLIAHINLGYVNLNEVEVLVLDEADRMLDMGFIDDIMKIISHLPKKRQTLLFSATMAGKIRALANKILQNPKHINLAVAKPAEGIIQTIYSVYNNNKIKLLEHLLEEKQVQNMLIFASRKNSVDDIYRSLKKLPLNVMSIHSGKEQVERTEIMRQFKAGKIQVLVATDVLSRGIDIDELSHVLNYDIPSDAVDYVHRVGRTARADKTGEAISFVNEEDQYKVLDIEALIENKIPMLNTPAEIGDTPDFNPTRWKKKSFRKKTFNKKKRFPNNQKQHKKRY